MADAKQSKPVLTYFAIRGLAEVTRLMLAEGKIDYTDHRYAMGSDDWKAVKHTCPFAQIPTFKTASGTTLAQSGAIERYVARQAKLYGATDLEGAQIDMVVEGVRDMMKNLSTAVWTKDEAEKKTKIEAYFKDEFPRWAGQFTALLKSNKDGKEYFVGNGVSYADIMFFNAASGSIATHGPKAIEAFPELKALVERVGARPNIAAWVKSRPVTPF